MKPDMTQAVLLALASSTVGLYAHAEIYMSEADSAAAIFPGQKFERKDVELKPDEITKVERASGQSVRNPKMRYFRSTIGDTVFIDQVLGKHEFITYAVGVRADGKVAGIEIIEYRESYGQQVRKPEWRGQFVGKDATSPLKLEGDIKNLSGATLSSAHVTGGVKRVVQSFGLIRDRL